MNAKSAIEKLQRIIREKEVLKSEHRRRQEEEAKLSRRIKMEEQLKKAEREGVLNIQSMAIRSLSYSSLSLKCA